MGKFASCFADCVLNENMAGWSVDTSLTFGTGKGNPCPVDPGLNPKGFAGLEEELSGRVGIPNVTCPC